jgi:hypothetical protein
MIGWYRLKLFIEHVSGISMDALHILVGFFLFVLAARLLKRPLGSFLPLVALLLVELANEAYDLRVELWPNLATQLGEGAKDILLTMILPTAVFVIARCRPAWLAGGNLPRE